MKTTHKILLTSAAAIAMGLMSASASAHDRHGHGRHWHGHRYYDPAYVTRYYYPPQYAVRERVLVERPVYVPPPSPYYYAPVRRPGVVVSVDIPPIVIPLR